MEGKRYHIIFASIVFAAAAWLTISLGDEYTIVKHMPVLVENLKEGRALKYPVPRAIDVWFRGNGWQLAALSFSSDVKYYIDFSSVGEENFTITKHDLFEHIKLPVSLQPIDVKPDTLILALDEYVEKRVPIIPHIVLEFYESYGQVGSLKLSPESVMIGGSKMLLATIAGWPTIYRKFTGVHTTIDEVIPFDEPLTYSLRLFEPAVRMLVNVQPFAEKAFTGIPLVATGIPANREVLFVPPKIDLIVRGGIDRLAKLTNADFLVTIGYQELVRDSSEYIFPSMGVPAEVKIVHRKPERFQYIIRKRL